MFRGSVMWFEVEPVLLDIPDDLHGSVELGHIVAGFGRQVTVLPQFPEGLEAALVERRLDCILSAVVARQGEGPRTERII